MNSNQGVLFEAPEPESSEWKTFPADGGDLRYKQIDEKTTAIDFDGEILTATRGAEEKYAVRDSEGRSILPNRPRGFRNTMSRVTMVRNARREMAREAEARARWTEARASADTAIERVLIEVESELEDAQPAKPRCRNKLATVRAQIAEKRYIDPFGEKQTSLFFYITPAWLVRARDEPEGLTWLEIAVYSRLTHPVTFKDGGFCKRFCKGSTAAIIDLDLRSLAEWLRADYKATRKAFASLVDRGLLEEVENDKQRGPKTVRFRWHRWMEETGLKPVSSEEKEAFRPSATGLKPVSPHILKNKDNLNEAAEAIDDGLWLDELASKHGFSKEKEWKRFLKWCANFGKEPSRRLFENSHIPNIERPVRPKIEHREIEPAEFSNWFAATYPNQEPRPWSESPTWMKDEFTRAQRAHLTT